MNGEMMSVCVIFGSIGGAILISLIVNKIMDFFYKKKDKKHHKEHPEFFRLRDEFAEKADTAYRFYNNEISPRKRKIDSMLKEEPYWPQQVREQKLEEVEKLRCGIYTAEWMYKGLNKDTEEARQKVVEYVREHNIKWAGVWE